MKKARIAFAILCGAVVGWYLLPYLCPVTVPGFMGHEIRLRHGYKIVNSGCEDYTLSQGIFVIISPVIDGYRVRGNIVIGHVKKYDSMSKPGYFLVDTRTNGEWQGLSKRELAKHIPTAISYGHPWEITYHPGTTTRQIYGTMMPASIEYLQLVVMHECYGITIQNIGRHKRLVQFVQFLPSISNTVGGKQSMRGLPPESEYHSHHNYA